MLTHVVLFQFHRVQDAEKTKELLLSLQGKIPELRGIEVGVDVLRSERSYDLALITRFDSLFDMHAYQVHPSHQEVLAFIKTVVKASVAVDYESESE